MNKTVKTCFSNQFICTVMDSIQTPDQKAQVRRFLSLVVFTIILSFLALQPQVNGAKCFLQKSYLS